jgi:hypothetical protein
MDGKGAGNARERAKKGRTVENELVPLGPTRGTLSKESASEGIGGGIEGSTERQAKLLGVPTA